jgi:hypothetical protein
MAIDATSGFTLGGLDSAPGGNSARIALLQFTLEFNAAVDIGYTVREDGVVTTAVGTGAATADLTMTTGGGFTLKQTVGDAAADVKAEYIVSFGDIAETYATMGADTTQNITVVGAHVSVGADLGGATGDPLVYDVDAVCPVAVSAFSGNSFTFSVGHPATVSDGAADLNDFTAGTTDLVVSIVAFLQPTN